jgi:chromosome segregation ATPase
MILTHAPIRLLKLKFKRLETLLKQELKAADIEISEECLALNENVDLNEILRRHEAKFKHSDFYRTCESYLQELRTCTNELNEKKTDDKSNVDEILDYLQSYWTNLTKKIETMNAKLTILPDTKDNFERNFNQFSSWLTDIERNYESLNNNNLSSLSEYRRLAEKCQVNHGVLFFCILGSICWGRGDENGQNCQ